MVKHLATSPAVGSRGCGVHGPHACSKLAGEAFQKPERGPAARLRYPRREDGAFGKQVIVARRTAQADCKSAFRLLALLVAAFARVCAPAQEAPLEKDPLAMEEIPELSPWEPFANVRAGGGYKDNVSLSHFARESSAFSFTELEAFLIRLPFDGSQVRLYGLAEDVRYWARGTVDKEQLLLALAECKRIADGGWQFGITGQYSYLDKVFDVSATEQNITAVQAQANWFTLRSSVRRDFGAGWWVELEPEGNRLYFISPLDDVWRGGARLTLGRSYGNQSDVSVFYRFDYGLYDSREQVSAGGVVIPGEPLRFHEHESEAAWRHYWDEERRWRTTLKWNAARRQDNGPGFFDHWRWQVGGQVRYRGKQWEARADVQASLYRYSVQPVSATDARLRSRTFVTATVRGERKLGKHWRLFAEYEHELSGSNRVLDDYHANTVKSGFDLEF